MNASNYGAQHEGRLTLFRFEERVRRDTQAPVRKPLENNLPSHFKTMGLVGASPHSKGRSLREPDVTVFLSWF